MFEGVSSRQQTVYGTLFTWGLTALGSCVALFVKGEQRAFLDVSLGFAAGVMLAASFWSLLEPALSMAESSVGASLCFLPVALGLVVGAAFVWASDKLIHFTGASATPLHLFLSESEDEELRRRKRDEGESGELPVQTRHVSNALFTDGLRHRRLSASASASDDSFVNKELKEDLSRRWRRILLLILAVTVHNIPEGLAVGVAFGAANKTKGGFETARNLALGIGIQNFPEGLAVSVPLKAAGMSTWRSIWYGQLSGLVEPLAGFLGHELVVHMEPLLPYSLAFAAGAMIYVVIDDIVPEMHSSGNGAKASWGGVLGFVVMMCLDVGLG